MTPEEQKMKLLELTSNVAGQIYAAHMRIYGKQFSALNEAGEIPAKCAKIAKKIIYAVNAELFNAKK